MDDTGSSAAVADDTSATGTTDVPEVTPDTTPAGVEPGATGGAAALVAATATATRPKRKQRQILVWLATGWLALIALAALFGSWLPLDPDTSNYGNRLAPPFSDGHILGTDNLGRDVLARLVVGARFSMIIGLSAVSIGMVVGGGLGLLVGYFRGWTEGITMWLLNVILAFPGLVLLLGIIAFVGQSLMAVTVVVGLLAVPTYARMARATTLAVSQREYVLSARAMGATNRRIMFGEILPNVVLPVAAFGLVALGTLIVLETSLAFLGLSVDEPTWGSMIAEGRPHLHTTTHLAFIPSLVVFLTVLAVNFVGDHARSRFDVKESRL